MRLKDKVAIVTGGGSGFGEGIVRKFVAEGAQVLIADRDLAAGLRVAAAVGPAARALKVDVTDKTDVQLMMETAELHFGRIDILVNNAGIGHLPQPLEELPEDEFDRITAVNMRAIYLAMREIVPRFKANAPGVHGQRGVVLNMASTAGVSPRPRLAWYNASKGWVITATRACAVELAPAGIRVVALNPVAGDTPLLKTFMGEDTPEMRAKFLSSIPIGRLSLPEDLGNAACFLCSDEATMLTGVCMEVDGGRCI
ncbi:glucose 1-dehydrogenase [Aquabacterium sp.]|uniref:glucose 1-dehydrogenase n=1 Tax=Aquabacterium sp. TaxID=1872578 RepID=UPI002C8161D2|nr:glucose 1-dehydrogenase [Aquabacterium sp.]HSW03429.1 glucose 1-dehydrogenase [Aquabacterium sp.]